MKQLKFECPECGTEFTITANQPKAKERIEALKKAGIDVSNLFAMQGPMGRILSLRYKMVSSAYWKIMMPYSRILHIRGKFLIVTYLDAG